MSSSQWFASKSTLTTAPGTWYGTLPCGHVGPSSAEAGIQAPSRSAGTFSKLYIRVTANDRTATSTLTFRNAGADGSQQVSIGAGLTGEFMDSSSTDAVLGGGELLNYKLIVGSGGTVFTWALIGILFQPNTGQVVRYEALGLGSTVAPGNTQYQSLTGLGSTQATEANEQHKIRLTGTLKRLFANIATNSLTTATTTIRTRVNGANGAQSVSIGAGLTGVFEDTSNTDSVVSGDLVNYQTVVAAGGAGTLTYGNIGCELLVSSGDQYQLMSATSNGVSVALSTTTYLLPSGVLASSTTEDNHKGRVNTPGFITSKLQAFVISNTITATTTIRTRKNNANGAQTLSIGSGLTGFFEDASNTDTYATNDFMNYQIVTGGSGTAIRFNNLGVLVTPLGVIAPSSIASALAFGTLKLIATIFPATRASGLSFGTLSLSAQIAPTSIASTAVVPTGSKINLVIFPATRSSGLLFGTLSIFASGVISPSAIASTLSFGALQLNYRVFPSSRASTLVVNNVSLRALISPASVASTLGFGTAKVNLTIFPNSKSSGLLFGALRISGASQQFILPVMITSTLTIGGLYVVELLVCTTDWRSDEVVGPSGFQADVPIRAPSSGVGGWG